MDSVLDGSQKQIDTDLDDSSYKAEEELEEAQEAQNDEDYSPELVDEEEFVDPDDELDESLTLVTKTSAKEKNAHELEVRRAIEERLEEKQMSAELDYLDLDFD